MIDKLIIKIIGEATSYTKAANTVIRDTNKLDNLWKDANGKWRQANGQFASGAQMAAAGVGKTTSKVQGLTNAINGYVTKAVAGAAKIGKGFQQAGQKISSMGRTMTVGVTLPLIAMGTNSVTAFAKFDQAMTESTSIMNVTEKTAERMANSVMALSTNGDIVKGPTELAKSYFFLASAGLDAEQSIAALPTVGKFATAGAFDMALATDLLTDSQSALGLTVKDSVQNMRNMARVSDVLVKANTLANGSVQQFSEALGNDAGATLKNYNKDMEEGVAVLAAYADQSIKGLEAGSMLGRMTRLLSKSALDNAKAHKQLGFSVFDNQGKMRNYADIIKNLEVITKGMSDETKAATLKQLGFAALTQKAILPLLGMSEQIREYEAGLRAAGGTTDAVASKQMRSFSNQMKILKNQTTVAAIELGKSLAPIVLRLNQLLKRGIAAFQSLSPEMRTNVAAALAVAAALGPLLVVVGTLISSVGTLITVFSSIAGVMAGVLTPIGWVVVAVLAAIAAVRLWKGNWEDTGVAIGNAMNTAVEWIITMVRIFKRSVVLLVGWLKAQFDKFWSKDFITSAISGFKKVAELSEMFAKWIIQKLRAALTGSTTGTLDDFLNQVQNDFAEGQQSVNLLDSLKNIAAEERIAMNNRLGVPEQSSSTEGNEESNSKDILATMKGLLEVSKEQLNKEAVNLQPAGLPSL